MNLLPTAKTKAAQVLVSLKDTLATFVSPGIDPEQYLASAISEVNMLRMQFSDEQLSDPRTIDSIVKAVFNGAVVGLLLALPWDTPIWSGTFDIAARKVSTSKSSSCPATRECSNLPSPTTSWSSATLNSS